MLDYRVYTFLTLFKELNYRRCATKLNMTQPGVTQHIQFLEKYYGTKLFVYEGRTLSPTEDAITLHKFLTKVLAKEKALPEIFNHGGQVHIRIGATKTIGDFVILSELEKFIENKKNSIDLTIDNTKILLEMLIDLEIDFALIEGSFDKTQYDYHLYKKEKVVGICSKKHPFANKSIPFEDIFKETLFIREEGSGTRGLMEDVLSSKGYSLQNFERTMAVSSFAAIKKFVSDNKGITFAYEPVTKSDESLASFEIENMPVVREFNFVYLNKSIAIPLIDKIFKENQ